jgi:hypothetical protein
MHGTRLALTTARCVHKRAMCVGRPGFADPDRDRQTRGVVQARGVQHHADGVAASAVVGERRIAQHGRTKSRPGRWRGGAGLSNPHLVRPRGASDPPHHDACREPYARAQAGGSDPGGLTQVAGETIM